MLSPVSVTSCVTLREALVCATKVLANAGIETASYDASLLLAHVCNVNMQALHKAMLMDEHRLIPSQHSYASVVSQYAQVIARRANREPLQHITGEVTFRYVTLSVGNGVFIPRQETEMLVQLGLDWWQSQRAHKPRVVDLCAGSGAIGLSVASEIDDAQVWAVEASNEAFSWLRRNMQRVDGQYDSLHIAQRYQAILGDATQACTLQDLDGTIDMVLTNPPYIPQEMPPEQEEVVRFDPPMALYGGSSDGLLIPQRIMLRAYHLLRPGGLLVMEHDSSQGEALVEYANTLGMIKAHTINDLTGRPRFTSAVKTCETQE